jgi:hypothetical protein
VFEEGSIGVRLGGVAGGGAGGASVQAWGEAAPYQLFSSADFRLRPGQPGNILIKKIRLRLKYVIMTFGESLQLIPIIGCHGRGARP